MHDKHAQYARERESVCVCERCFAANRSLSHAFNDKIMDTLLWVLRECEEEKGLLSSEKWTDRKKKGGPGTWASPHTRSPKETLV